MVLKYVLPILFYFDIYVSVKSKILLCTNYIIIFLYSQILNQVAVHSISTFIKANIITKTNLNDLVLIPKNKASFNDVLKCYNLHFYLYKVFQKLGPLSESVLRTSSKTRNNFLYLL